MNFAKLNMVQRAETGAVYPVRYPGLDELTGAELTVLGADAPVAIEAAMQYKRERVKIEKDGDPFDMLNEQKRRIVKVVVTGWSGFEGDDGKPLEFSKERWAKMVDDPGFLWLVDDVYAFSGKRANFFSVEKTD